MKNATWSLLRLSLALISLVIILIITADKFNDTEVTTIICMLLLGVIFEATYLILKA